MGGDLLPSSTPLPVIDDLAPCSASWDFDGFGRAGTRQKHETDSRRTSEDSTASDMVMLDAYAGGEGLRRDEPTSGFCSPSTLSRLRRADWQANLSDRCRLLLARPHPQESYFLIETACLQQIKAESGEAVLQTLQPSSILAWGNMLVSVPNSQTPWAATIET